MPPARDMLLAVVEAVADGQSVDWTSAEATPMSDDERSVLAQLKVLEQLYRVHRTGEAESTSAETDDLGTTPIVDSREQSAREPNAASTTAGPIPERWGPLEIREVLGVGGFGVVYRAWDPHLASEVALKVLTRETTGVAAVVIREARLLARVRHPNIVSIYGADRINGQVGLWMELVRGRTLKQQLKQHGTFGAREAALVGLDLTRALAAVHGAGLVHRDVKPHNVMRDERGRIVLMDFGAGVELEELNQGAQRKYVGTPLYMAPELFERHQPSAQTDLYSLGVLLFHLVTSTYPVEGASPTEVGVKHLRNERRRLRDVRPDLPTEFVRIVERAIDPDVARRYQSAGELEDDLAQFVVHQDRRLVDRETETLAATRHSRRNALMAAAAVVLLIAGGLSIAKPWRRWTASPPGTLRSLVVLPLRNGTGDRAQDYFVDGMTDLLTADLSGVSALRVIADSAADRYRGTKKSVGEIARELHVDGVVEGSVSRSGDRVRVTVQLVHAGTNLSLWGSSFEREAKDAFRLQADIARAVVSELRAALTPDERKRLEQIYAANPEAQDLYLRARSSMHTYNRDRLPEARTLLERAVQIDPNYALAWSSLSACYIDLQDWGLLSPAESRRLGLAAAQTALERDQQMYEAQYTMAEALFKFDWNWTEADLHYRRALEANPSFSQARFQYARFLSAAGRVDEAVAQARLAEQLDPVSNDVKATVALMLVYQRHFAEALAKADEAMLDPNQQRSHVVRARALSGLGRVDEAIGELREAIRLSGGQPGQLADLGRLYATTGRRAEAEQILRTLSQPPDVNGNFFTAQDAAYVQIGLGRYDEALANLERAVNDRSERVLWLRVDPKVDSVRNDPRFERLLERIGGLPAPR